MVSSLALCQLKKHLIWQNRRTLTWLKLLRRAILLYAKLWITEIPFEQAKRERKTRKNQRVVDIKEVRLSLNIDTHDFNTKLNNALKFIKHGDKVKVSIRFRGREMGHPEIGLETMKRFADACSETAVVEKPAKLEGRNMLMFLAPKTNK